jgi:hypothetical protein
MFSAAFKMMRISYRLIWIALVTITGGAGALAFHFVAVRLVRRTWRAWMRPSKQRRLPGVNRNGQAAHANKRTNAVQSVRHMAVRDEAP